VKHEPTENAMAQEHERQERIIKDSYDKHKPLTSSHNPSMLHRCPNPNCINGWHGKEVQNPNKGVCIGSWAWNDDGTPREGMDGGRFAETYNQPEMPPNDRLSRFFGPLRDREER